MSVVTFNTIYIIEFLKLTKIPEVLFLFFQMQVRSKLQCSVMLCRVHWEVSMYRWIVRNSSSKSSSSAPFLLSIDLGDDDNTIPSETSVTLRQSARYSIPGDLCLRQIHWSNFRFFTNKALNLKREMMMFRPIRQVSGSNTGSITVRLVWNFPVINCK